MDHYSKAKIRAQAERINKSFEYCVGLKRSRYRVLSPKNYFGKLYDKDWAEHATEKDIEQLGVDQMIQFIEIEGHFFDNRDVYELNNEFIKKYF